MYQITEFSCYLFFCITSEFRTALRQLYVTYITFGVHQFVEVVKWKNLWKTVHIFYDIPIHMFMYIVPSLQIEFTATWSVVFNIFTFIDGLKFLVSRVMYVFFYNKCIILCQHNNIFLYKANIRQVVPKCKPLITFVINFKPIVFFKIGLENGHRVMYVTCYVRNTTFNLLWKWHIMN